MNESIYIRPLRVEDALVSHHWRNNPRIWKYTGSRPDRYITHEIETKWIEEVLQRENERRFAICRIEDDMYIGNVYLTDMADGQAQMHVFLGDIQFWGKNNAYEAVSLLRDMAFDEFNIDRIYITINKNNHASIALAKRVGYVESGGVNGDIIDFEITREMFDKIKPEKN